LNETGRSVSFERPRRSGAIDYAVENIKKLIGHVPVFWNLPGHQLCGLALGGKTFKLNSAITVRIIR